MSDKTEKQKQRDEIARQTKEFLDKGKKIEVLENSASGIPSIKLSHNQKRRIVGKKGGYGRERYPKQE